MAVSRRDLRLDFFRGVALIFIFLNHIPDNLLSYLTLAHFVFNDAAEVFVFISGYAAALVFGRVARDQGWVMAGAQVLRRCWTLYVAHIFLFVIYTAQVSYAARTLDNPMFADEMGVADFLNEPHVAILRALSLRLQPTFMDILPMYIVLLLATVPILALIRRSVALTLALSVGIYAAAILGRFNLEAYPHGTWYFNPLSWQIVFVIGMVLGYLNHVVDRAPRLPAWVAAASFGVLAFLIVLKFVVSSGAWLILAPAMLIELTWALTEKSFQGPLRLLNLLVLVHVVVSLVPRDSGWLHAAGLKPIVVCGMHSLNIFCVGVFLSVAAHIVLGEIGHGFARELVVSAAGIAIMVAIAQFLEWTKDRNQPRTPAMAAPSPLGRT